MVRYNHGAIAVLGRELNTNAKTLKRQLGPTNRARLDKGTRVWRQRTWEGLNPYFLVSGKGLQPGMIEALKMGRYAILRGVSEHAIRYEIHSLDTWGNAIHTRKIAESLGITALEVCTSGWHEPRATRIFRHTFGLGFLISGLGTNEVPTCHDLRGEESGLIVAQNVIQNSTPGDIASIELALANEMEIYRRQPMALAA